MKTDSDRALNMLNKYNGWKMYHEPGTSNVYVEAGGERWRIDSRSGFWGDVLLDAALGIEVRVLAKQMQASSLESRK